MSPDVKKQLSSYTQEFECLQRMLSATLLVNDSEGFLKALNLMEGKLQSCKAQLLLSDMSLQVAG